MAERPQDRDDQVADLNDDEMTDIGEGDDEFEDEEDFDEDEKEAEVE